MWSDALLATFHHLTVGALLALLVAEIAMLARPLDADALRRLGRVDGLYGLAALMVLVAGFTRALAGAKGFAFYSANPLFWTKLGLFVLIGLASIVPTVRYLRWRRARRLPTAEEQRNTRSWTWAQLAGLALIPVIAPMMARGIGL